MISGRSSPGSGRGGRDDGLARHVPRPWHPVVRHRLALPASLPQDPCAFRASEGVARSWNCAFGVCWTNTVRWRCPRGLGGASVSWAFWSSPHCSLQSWLPQETRPTRIGTLSSGWSRENTSNRMRLDSRSPKGNTATVVRNGVELIAWYDSEVFTGTVTNTTREVVGSHRDRIRFRVASVEDAAGRASTGGRFTRDSDSG